MSLNHFSTSINSNAISRLPGVQEESYGDCKETHGAHGQG